MTTITTLKKRFNMKVRKIDTTFKITLGNLQDYMSEVCSVVRDKEPKSAAKLWDRLLVESFGKKPSSTFSFIPCVLDAQAVLLTMQSRESVQFFGRFAESKYYTNARELLNWGANIEDVLASVSFSNYEAFKCEAPYMVYQQIRTHSQLNFISHSARYTQSTHGYWKPDEVHVSIDEWNRAVRGLTPTDLQGYLKDDCKIVRREVFARGADMFQNRVFAVGGYTNNENAFPHFLNQRSDSHTQLETRIFVTKLKEELK